MKRFLKLLTLALVLSTPAANPASNQCRSLSSCNNSNSHSYAFANIPSSCPDALDKFFHFFSSLFLNGDKKMDILSPMPPELLYEIASYLSLKDFCSLMQVNKTVHEKTNSPAFIKKFIKIFQSNCEQQACICMRNDIRCSIFLSCYLFHLELSKNTFDTFKKIETITKFEQLTIFAQLSNWPLIPKTLAQFILLRRLYALHNENHEPIYLDQDWYEIYEQLTPRYQEIFFNVRKIEDLEELEEESEKGKEEMTPEEYDAWQKRQKQE